jgi:hypothetical protein
VTIMVVSQRAQVPGRQEATPCPHRPALPRSPAISAWPRALRPLSWAAAVTAVAAHDIG